MKRTGDGSQKLYSMRCILYVRREERASGRVYYMKWPVICIVYSGECARDVPGIVSPAESRYYSASDTRQHRLYWLAYANATLPRVYYSSPLGSQ